MRALLLWLIRIYQIRISPYKGFACAYRLRRGGRSCSCFGFTVIERFGVLRGVLLLRRRLRKCGAAGRATTGLVYQSGHCDLPLPDCDPGNACDFLNELADCGSNCAGCDDGDCLRQLWKKWRAKRAGAQ
jgi:putative component of membrane protein insertase Oxa1/YidC/SpoIIIJ protein YidD